MSILLAGGLTSGLMSLIQLHAMETPFSARLWVLASVAGGATAGGCILFLMSAILIVMIFSWTRFGLAIPFLIIGSLYGLSVGSAQGLIIGQKRHIWGYYWAIGWCFSGGICALTSLPAMSVWLCWPGPILFGLVMGTIWFHLKRALNNLT